MKKDEIVFLILGEKLRNKPISLKVKAFAATNIALCKYWGKRNQELNLPITNSLSISMGNRGATTELMLNKENEDRVIYNDQPLNLESGFCKRLIDFLNLFRKDSSCFLHLNIHSNIPLAAGLASSASGFASIVKALNLFFEWNLSHRELSILARLGSGSASRSIQPGFVEWHAGLREDGMDSFAEKLSEEWFDLCIGLLIFTQKEKPISSREAMQRTVMTSPFYPLWPNKVEKDLVDIRLAMREKNFFLLGKAAESNALAMHATMLTSWPPVNYNMPETLIAIEKIWSLRQEGFSLFFTQDAGPNLKLLFLEKEVEVLKEFFPTIEIVRPFKEEEK